MSDQQFGCVKAARALGKQYADRELVNDELKGKLDCKWFGHSGFKISFKDAEEIQRSIYIDIWIDNKDCPEEEKKDCPNDCDLALVTHGQLDHSMHAPFLMMGSHKEGCQIVSTPEICKYYNIFRKIPLKFLTKLSKGATKDFGFARITMVTAEHPSTLVGPQGLALAGGSACGFIIHIPNLNLSLYHAGDTNVFGDMKLINDLYEPTIAFLPIGDCLGMGPKEATYALTKFLTKVKTCVPMHFNTFPVQTGTPEAFKQQLERAGSKVKVIHPKEFHGGNALVEADKAIGGCCSKC